MDHREFFSRFRYLSKGGPGIGGRIKAQPEDFVVIEEPLPAIFEGRKNAIFLLKKRNWDTMSAVKEIAKRAGISYRDVGFAGTKDRHAVTHQYVSVPAEAKERVENVRIRDIELRFVSYGRFIKLGHLLGNRFRIIVRDVDESAFGLTREIIRELREKGGFPNYFGYQRFGERRVTNHLIGKLLLRGDFEGAARLFLGGAHGGGMEGDEARRNFWESGDVERALEEFPNFLRYERTLLHRYKETGSWKKAFLSLPLPIMRIFIHAYQSYLFNLYLSRRIEELPLNEALVGDIVVGVKGGIPYRDRTYRVTETNVNFVNGKIRKNRAMVSGPPLFGFAMRRAAGLPGELERGILEEEGINPEAFKKLPKPMREPGGRRELLIRPLGMTYGYVPGTGMCFRFFLPKGVYATSVLREITKDH